MPFQSKRKPQNFEQKELVELKLYQTLEKLRNKEFNLDAQVMMTEAVMTAHDVIKSISTERRVKKEMDNLLIEVIQLTEYIDQVGCHLYVPSENDYNILWNFTTAFSKHLKTYAGLVGDSFVQMCSRRCAKVVRSITTPVMTHERAMAEALFVQ